MTIAPGTRLGPYEIVAPLGAGGMGEVFRGRDTRLGRDVAIKILPEGFAQNEQFRARFEREARTISSLNHPNICTLFDVGSAVIPTSDTRRDLPMADSSPASRDRNDATPSARNDGGTAAGTTIHYLVMELMEGESLADRLQKGALPPDQVLKYGAQIADALDRAHKQGIVHRDLKPGNVMLTKTGAKLLDFGLARPGSDSGIVHGMTEMPTQAKPLTQEGTILGTFQYMAPEQLEGAEADARTDIFSLGALLYEMATGKRAFEGHSKTSLIAAIVSSQPAPISSVAPMTPPALDHVVRKCLEKDPDDRWQSVHDVSSELRWISEAGSQAGVATNITVRRKSRERLAWALAAVLALAAGALLVLQQRVPRPRLARLAVWAPREVSVFQAAGNVAISPDGRTIVFVGTDSGGRSGLWVRSLADTTPRLLPKTTDASYPFWSPDSRHIAFFAEGRLKRVPANGGDIDEICAAPDGRGGSWSGRDVIVFSPTVSSGLMRVDANGGEPSAVTTLDPSRKEESHRFPWFLPDGERFLFKAEGSGTGSIDAGSIESKERTSLLKADRAAIYAEPGYLVYGDGDRIFARRFDAETLAFEGDATRLPDAMPASVNTGDRVASVSSDGVMVIPSAIERDLRLAWFDRQGRVVGTIPLPRGTFLGPRISPDGKRAAIAMFQSESSVDLWIVDLVREAPTRLTFGPKINNLPVWSPDGNRLLYHSNRGGTLDLYVRQLAGGGADTLLFSSPMNWKEPSSWSPDGSTIAFTGIEAATTFDIWLVPASGKGKPTPYLQTPANERAAAISPDGRWLAYASNESGRFEVYVQSFPTPGVKYQVTNLGGSDPHWTKGGSELVYGTIDGGVGAVPVTLGENLQFGAPLLLFTPSRVQGIDVTADGERFLAVVPVEGGAAQSLSVILNWTEGLKK